MGLRGDTLVVASLLAVLPSACTGGAGPGDSAGGSPSPGPAISETSDCAGLAASIIDAVQRYIDRFDDAGAAQVGEIAAAGQSDLTETAAVARRQAEILGCDADELDPLIAREAERLHGDGPVTSAVADTFRAAPLGLADPSDQPARRIAVRSADELVGALNAAGSGSTIVLAPGEYELDRPLVVLRPVTITGAGETETTVRSSAEGAALLSFADGDLGLTDLTIRHVGDHPGSVVVVRDGGYRIERVTVAGARTADDGSGGYGLVLHPDPGGIGTGGTTRSVVDVTLRDDERGGVVVAGSEQPTISGVRVDGTDGCGVCFMGSSGGTVDGGELVGAAIGVRVDDGAAPTVAGLTIRDGGVGVALTGSGDVTVRDTTVVGNDVGIDVGGSATSMLSGLQVRDNADVGVRVSGRASPRLVDVVVEGGSDVGIAVVGDARPEVRGGRVAVEGDAGVLWLERGGGRLVDVTVTTSRLGLQIAGVASPTLSGLTIRDVGDAAAVATEDGSGTIDGVTCDGTDSGVVVLLERSDPELGDDIACEVRDQRGS